MKMLKKIATAAAVRVLWIAAGAAATARWNIDFKGGVSS